MGRVAQEAIDKEEFFDRLCCQYADQQVRRFEEGRRALGMEVGDDERMVLWADAFDAMEWDICMMNPSLKKLIREEDAP